MLVVGNFNTEPQTLAMAELSACPLFLSQDVKDLVTGERLKLDNHALVIPPLSFYWLSE